MVAGMLQKHLQKIANVTLQRTPSHATELLEAEPQSSEMEKVQEHAKEEPTISQTEEIRGSYPQGYSARPRFVITTLFSKHGIR